MLSSNSSMPSLLESLSLSDSDPLDSDPLLFPDDELPLEESSSSSELLVVDARLGIGGRPMIVLPPVVRRGDGVLIGLDGRAGIFPDVPFRALLLFVGRSSGLIGCDAIWIFRRLGVFGSGVAFLLLP